LATASDECCGVLWADKGVVDAAFPLASGDYRVVLVLIPLLFVRTLLLLGSLSSPDNEPMT